ncbi:toll-like receptor 8 [Eucyclogobius newberryi]|uniref:toll-like receptor 8 n=1 Tax=Eucyclogobius newberryi TaxID=166745 RepID=UPI003B5CF107
MPRKFPCDVTECGSNVTFDCSMRNLKNISDILEHFFPNATELNLTKNAIPNISQDTFSKLLNLSVLDLRWVNGNKRVIIDENTFKELKNLQVLKLDGIELDHIPANLPVSLKILVLNYNHIFSLNRHQLSALENITTLWLSKNCFSGNQCGQYFKITDDAFETMRKLEQLDLAFNNLSRVPQNLPNSLLKLDLETNRIEYIYEKDFCGLHNLTHLMIQGNCPRCGNSPYPCVPCKNISLQIHPRAFRDLKMLHTLNLGGNSLKYLHYGWFKNMSNLKTLLLPFNFLLNSITGEQEWLKWLPKLNILDLSFNYGLMLYPPTLNLSGDFVYLKSLVTLHLEAAVFKQICPHTLEPLYQIKTLSSLNLATNFIIHLAPDVFNKFPPMKLILLSENRLYPVSVDNNPPECIDTQYDQMSASMSTSLPTRRVPDYKVHRHVKEGCYNAGNVLIISRNNLFFISKEQFKGYKDIACLDLSHNGFSVALNGTEFSLLPNLTYLDLSFNKIDLVYNWAFKDLPKLEVLDISYNSHYFEAVGITHNLHFTVNLPVLRVLNMSFNNIISLTTKKMLSHSLSELQFQHNNLGELWEDDEYHNIFTHLTNLSILDISYNGIEVIPPKMYENLPKNLTQLIISYNLLTDYAWDNLNLLKQLQILNLSHNSLSTLTFNSDKAPLLKVLDLSYNQIVKLDKGLLAAGNNLKTLYLNNNELTIINQSQSDQQSEVETLYIDNNPFQCTCDSLDFILWLESSTVKIPKLLTDVKCDTPKMPKSPLLIYFDIQQCVNDNEASKFYIVTTLFIFVFLFVTMGSHLFYWDAFYILYILKAKLKGYSRLHSPESAYDAFVAYDTSDPYVSKWVMEKLQVKLEGEGMKDHPLCLEERDWCPGTPVLENLSRSIRNSRKTLFVLTEDYVKTGMFKLAIYLAHQRLLDENVDVILVLMLEPVLQHSHFLRLRKRLCDKSVLEWPKTAAAQSWFWQNLKNIITVDNEVLYNRTYTNYFTSR